MLMSLLSLGVLAAAQPVPLTFWYPQVLSHFAFTQNASQTFQQRYLVDSTHWNPKTGSIIFYTGNEGPIDGFWDNSGFLFELAPKFDALVVFAEHRYYGESLPFGNASFDADNLVHLNVEEALADYAAIVAHVKQQFGAPDDVYVAVAGGSYGGMLSAWFRMRYPQTVDAALAASAPVLFIGTGNVSTPTYFQTTTQDYRAANSACPAVIKAGFEQIAALAANGSYAVLNDVFNLCTPVASAADVEHLILWAVNSYGSLAMMDYPYPTDFMGNLPGFPVKLSCAMALQAAAAAQDPYRLARAVAVSAGLFYNGTNGTMKCFDIWSEFVFCADQTGCGTGPSGLSWWYQACTEMVYFPNTDGVSDMFLPRNWTLANLTALCQAQFGVVPRQGFIASEFGASYADIRRIGSNIIWSNGLLDPWHGGGVLQTLSDSMPAVLIAEGAHHLDLRASNPKDPASVIAARKTEEKYLAKWRDVKYAARRRASARA